MSDRKPIRPKQATSTPDKQPDPNVKIRNPSLLDWPVFMMCFPAGWDTDDPNNAFMLEFTEDELQEDYRRAYSEWMSLYGWLTSPETRVLELPSKEDFPDAVYCANVGIILCHGKKPIAVASNYKSPPRKGEYKVFQQFIEMYGYECHRPPFTWEGEADLKHQRDNIYVGGYGQRTDIRALEWFEKKFDMRVIKCRMTDEKLYHWDCTYFPLTAEKALVCTSVLEKSEVREIEKVCEIIDVSRRRAHVGTTNCVRTMTMLLVASSKFVYKEGTKEWKEEVDKENFLQGIAVENGMSLVPVCLSEFEKSGAALSCLVLHVNRAAYAQPIT
jgi:N-dimethylarginine dimethylaminohydrolase